MAELLNVASGNPFTYKEAMESDSAQDWVDACQYEMDALDKLKVWCLEPLPKGRKAVKSKWVFKKKADGHFCARLVAKGFTQLEGVDFDKTFSPVARFESLRLLLVLATLEDWEIHQMDVKSAFLHGELEEEIYMEQPIGFVTAGKEHLVCSVTILDTVSLLSVIYDIITSYPCRLILTAIQRHPGVIMTSSYSRLTDSI